MAPLIAALWVLLYYLNHTLFRFTEVTQLTSLIFIPSGFKIAVTAILRTRAWLGLFLGSILTGYLFLKNFSAFDVVVFSMLSATLPFLALRLSEYFLPLKRDLSNLKIKHILLMGLIYAALNGAFHVGYRYHVLFVRDVNEMRELLSMMAGDVLGILISMLLIAKLSRLGVVQSLLKKIGG